jgi:hypothetical protein
MDVFADAGVRTFTVPKGNERSIGMSVTAIRGVIERRILANYRIDSAAVARSLAAPFRPKLVD